MKSLALRAAALLAPSVALAQYDTMESYYERQREAAADRASWSNAYFRPITAQQAAEWDYGWEARALRAIQADLGIGAGSEQGGNAQPYDPWNDPGDDWYYDAGTAAAGYEDPLLKEIREAERNIREWERIREVRREDFDRRFELHQAQVANVTRESRGLVAVAKAGNPIDRRELLWAVRRTWIDERVRGEDGWIEAARIAAPAIREGQLFYVFYLAGELLSGADESRFEEAIGALQQVLHGKYQRVSIGRLFGLAELDAGLSEAARLAEQSALRDSLAIDSAAAAARCRAITERAFGGSLADAAVVLAFCGNSLVDDPDYDAAFGVWPEPRLRELIARVAASREPAARLMTAAQFALDESPPYPAALLADLRAIESAGGALAALAAPLREKLDRNQDAFSTAVAKRSEPATWLHLADVYVDPSRDVSSVDPELAKLPHAEQMRRRREISDAELQGIAMSEPRALFRLALREWQDTLGGVDLAAYARHERSRPQVESVARDLPPPPLRRVLAFAGGILEPGCWESALALERHDLTVEACEEARRFPRACAAVVGRALHLTNRWSQAAECYESAIGAGGTLAPIAAVRAAELADSRGLPLAERERAWQLAAKLGAGIAPTHVRAGLDRLEADRARAESGGDAPVTNAPSGRKRTEWDWESQLEPFCTPLAEFEARHSVREATALADPAHREVRKLLREWLSIDRWSPRAAEIERQLALVPSELRGGARPLNEVLACLRRPLALGTFGLSPLPLGDPGRVATREDWVLTETAECWIHYLTKFRGQVFGDELTVELERALRPRVVRDLLRVAARDVQPGTSEHRLSILVVRALTTVLASSYASSFYWVALDAGEPLAAFDEVVAARDVYQTRTLGDRSAASRDENVARVDADEDPYLAAMWLAKYVDDMAPSSTSGEALTILDGLDRRPLDALYENELAAAKWPDDADVPGRFPMRLATDDLRREFLRKLAECEWLADPVRDHAEVEQLCRMKLARRLTFAELPRLERLPLEEYLREAPVFARLMHNPESVPLVRRLLEDLDRRRAEASEEDGRRLRAVALDMREILGTALQEVGAAREALDCWQRDGASFPPLAKGLAEALEIAGTDDEWRAVFAAWEANLGLLDGETLAYGARTRLRGRSAVVDPKAALAWLQELIDDDYALPEDLAPHARGLVRRSRELDRALWERLHSIDESLDGVFDWREQAGAAERSSRARAAIEECLADVASGRHRLDDFAFDVAETLSHARSLPEPDGTWAAERLKELEASDHPAVRAWVGWTMNEMGNEDSSSPRVRAATHLLHRWWSRTAFVEPGADEPSAGEEPRDG